MSFRAWMRSRRVSSSSAEKRGTEMDGEEESDESCVISSCRLMKFSWIGEDGRITCV